MRVGKLGEGVYKLTIGPSGRTVSRAKMVKAIKKPQEMRDEEDKVVAPAVTAAKWYSGRELLTEYGISEHRLYNHRDLIKQYIAKPDGIHYRYHEAMLKNEEVMKILQRPPRYRCSDVQLVATEITARLKTKAELAIAAESEPAPMAAEAPAQLEESPEIVPIKVERRVYCKELDRTYDSITLAAKAIGARREALSKALRAGQRCRGYTFTYVDDGHETPVQRKEKRAPTGCAVPKKVFCVDLNRAFNSLQEGAEAIGSTASALSAALRFGHRCKGHVFKYVDDPQRSDVQTRPVYCRELDKIFPSITAAAKAVNRSVPTMLGAIEKNYLCGGYHFTYA